MKEFYHCMSARRMAFVCIRAWSILLLMSMVLSASAQVTNHYYEGFEMPQAIDDWGVEGGTWEIGIPTFGPPTNGVGSRAYAGSRVAATVLAGNYGEGVRTRLVSPPFLVPRTNASPRLRFWHWFQFGDDADFGQVQVKVGTNQWQALSSNFIRNSGGVWSRPSLDLAAYANRTIQVAFWFQSDGTVFGNAVGPGWYIDEVTVETNQPSLPNPEGFELGLGDWSVDNGVWEVGVVRSGPGSARSGTNAAATVLAGSYGEGMRTRLISPPFTVPPTNAFPRLRFWHWLQFGDDADFGQVQVKVGTNQWQAFSSNFTRNSGGVWSRPALDLAAYANRTIQVAFWFQSDGTVFGNAVGPGWYIDEVTVETNQPSLPNPEGFELGLGDWSVDNGVWEVGVVRSGPGSAHSGTNAAATVLAGNYGEGMRTRLISPPFTVPPTNASPRLRFWHWFQFGDDADLGQVQVRVGTNQWQALSSNFTRNSGGIWSQPPPLDLSTFANKTIQIAFWFQSDGTVFGNAVGPGWYIDDVRLLHDFALVVDSTIVRTQQVFCLSLRTFASVPATSINFSLDIPALYLSDPILNTGGRFASATLTQVTNSEWSVTLQTTSTNALHGDEVIGSLCFKGVSARSAFVPLFPRNLVITNLDNSIPRAVALGGRVVLIANEPLIEASLGANRQRMLVLYGKANTTYAIQHTPALANTASPWLLGWTHTVPDNLFISSSLTGTFSNAPTLFLRANEQ